MDILVILHLTSLAFWLGVIAVEFIFERARIGKEVTAQPTPS
jgi:putative copper export protein